MLPKRRRTTSTGSSSGQLTLKQASYINLMTSPSWTGIGTAQPCCKTGYGPTPTGWNLTTTTDNRLLPSSRLPLKGGSTAGTIPTSASASFLTTSVFTNGISSG